MKNKTQKIRCLTAAILILFGLAAIAQAGTVNYTGGEGAHNWKETPSVWNATIGTGDTVNLDTAKAVVTSDADVTLAILNLYNGATLKVTDATFTASNFIGIGNTSETAKLQVGDGATAVTLNIGRLRVGNTTGSAGSIVKGEMEILKDATVNLTGGPTTTKDSYVAGQNFTNASLTINGGTLETSYRFFIASGVDSVGSLTIKNGGVFNYNHATISLDFGYAARSNATLTVDGGTLNHKNTALNLGNYNQTAKINLNINDGEINAAGLNVGWKTGTSATITQTGGNINAGTTNFGAEGTGYGDLNISGGTLNATVINFAAGTGSNSTVVQTGGTVKSTGAGATQALSIAQGTDSDVNYTISDGKIEAANRLYLGYGSNSTVTLTQTGGEITAAVAYVGARTGTGAADATKTTLNISDGTFKANTIYVGLAYATADVNVSGTGYLEATTGDLAIGYRPNAEATLEITNGGSAKGNRVFIGYNGSEGTAIVSDNAKLTSTNNLVLGNSAKTHTAKLEINNNAEVSAGSVDLFKAGITINGGSLNTTGNINVDNNTAATIDLAGGTLTADKIAIALSGTDFTGSLDITGAAAGLTLGSILVDLSGWTGDAKADILLFSTDNDSANYTVNFEYGSLAGLFEATETWTNGDLSISITAVPEPANVAAILAALAVVAVLIRRRKN